MCVAQAVLAHQHWCVVQREGDLFRCPVNGPRDLRRTGAVWKIVHASPLLGDNPPVQRVNAVPGAAARHRAGRCLSGALTVPRDAGYAAP